MTELLPCPFCGSNNVSEARDVMHWQVVRCDDCGSSGPCIELDRKKANALWNTRTDVEDKRSK
jgi:Lar family restriction alleviation protein